MLRNVKNVEYEEPLILWDEVVDSDSEEEEEEMEVE